MENLLSKNCCKRFRQCSSVLHKLSTSFSLKARSNKPSTYQLSLILPTLCRKPKFSGKYVSPHVEDRKICCILWKSNKLLELVEIFCVNGPLSVSRSPRIGILAQVYFFHTLIWCRPMLPALLTEASIASQFISRCLVDSSSTPQNLLILWYPKSM